LHEEFPVAQSGGRVLFVKGAEAGEALGAGLSAKGWQVDEVVAYRTVDAPPPRAEIAAGLATADVVTFLSPSAVSAYLRLTDTEGQPLVVPPVVACVGPTTSSAARAAGLVVAIEPPTASVEALVHALATHLGSVPGTPPPPP
jgi:uroporphyrinogen III methyltransferase/synthase